MRKIILYLGSALFAVLSARAQVQGSPAPTPEARWALVQQLKPGTPLHIKQTHGSVHCAFVSAGDDSLTCNHGSPVTLQKADIRSIKVPHRLRSTAVGFVAGAGIGAAVGAGISSSTDIGGRPLGALVFGVIGAVGGLAVGAATDFTQHTLYSPH